MNTDKTKLSNSEASKLLEAALQEMDGIISNNSIKPTLNEERAQISASNVLSTAKTLALALQQVGSLAPPPDATTSNTILDWLESYMPSQDLDERFRRLQIDKESLARQFHTLNEKFAAQNDKIFELERCLTEKTQQLNTIEDMLQKEIYSRSSLETQKLELVSAFSELKFQLATLEKDNIELRNNLNDGDATKSTPITNFNSFCYGGSVGNLEQSTNKLGAPKTPPASFRHQVHPQQYYSLPRSSVINSPKKTTPLLTNNNGNQRQCNVAFSDTEKVMIYDGNTDIYDSLPKREKKGLRNIFMKLRRCNSGNLEDLNGENELIRGGVRATASGRIEWSHSDNEASVSKPVTEWNINDLCTWMSDLGLAIYNDDCRKWLKSRKCMEFFEANPADIARELNLKSPLHRKKIVLAIDEITGKESDEIAIKAGKLDTSWIMRWLDDIGLPQYKDSFMFAKMDGRMLHKLTVEDLSFLHVSSCLHIASLRRAIQLMRLNQWNPDCLIRRSKSENNEEEPIALWTAHRVMEWLRVADLSEYAPNLRGAGVHGALMLYETKFTADLLADLLSIPPSKTLLRRHLATHFKELLGRDVIHVKRDAENIPGYQPLTLTAKIKSQKKTQFSLKRRKSAKGSELEWSEYVCPMSSTSGEQVNISSSSSN